MDRQEVIATNKSLRLIKNELEGLLEKGVVSDDIYDQILRILPAEASLRGVTSPAPSNNVAPPPVHAMPNLALNNNNSASPAPPSYQASAGGPPALPNRNNPPPPPPPSKPVIAHARALYKYAAADDRDLSFERDDKIAVHEYMNDDWWMGRNVRTGAEGIFPNTYVEYDNSQGGASGNGTDEKAAAAGGYGYNNYNAPQQPTYGGYGQQQQQNPYNSSVPPMAVAESSTASNGEQGGKASGFGKKVGKKLGNAAVFGAGATIGSNLVNSIF